MATPEIAYLGPPGTYSHLVTEKYFGRKSTMVPMPTVSDVCEHVAGNATHMGIVPIENSSGGAIYEMVDILLTGKPRVRVLEEVSLNVKLALIGGKGEKIKVLYSHFAPLDHCSAWLKRHLRGVERRVVASTASAAEHAARERHAAALGSRKLAGIYNLSVIHYPVAAEVPNITSFLALSGVAAKRHRARTTGPRKTTVAAWIPNEPGSLCTLLQAFQEHAVNLSRIISRPIRGCPRQYAFLVDIEGDVKQANVRRSLAQAREHCEELRIVGSYPFGRMYKS